MLNQITLIGRLVRDVDMRYTTNGTPVSNFTLAVERDYGKKEDGQKPVDFIDIVTWRKLAEVCAENIGKGRLVAVVGSLQIRKSENNGKTYINPEVVASTVRFLDWPSDGQANNSQTNNSNQNNSNNDLDIDESGFSVPF